VIVAAERVIEVGHAVVSHFFGVVMMMSAAQTVMMTTHSELSRTISVSFMMVAQQ
jgi:hypothetical protein